MSYVSPCYGCGADRVMAISSGLYCATCMNRQALEEQTETIKENALTQARLNYEASERSARIAEERNASIMRENERQAEEMLLQSARNAKLTAESQISAADIYEYGLLYIESKGLNDVYHEINDNGIKVGRGWNFKSYSLDHLNLAFDRGINDSLKNPKVLELVKAEIVKREEKAAADKQYRLEQQQLELENKRKQEIADAEKQAELDRYHASPEYKAKVELEKIDADISNVAKTLSAIIIISFITLIPIMLYFTDQGYKALIYIGILVYGVIQQNLIAHAILFLIQCGEDALKPVVKHFHTKQDKSLMVKS